jgi:hypothetical protein
MDTFIAPLVVLVVFAGFALVMRALTSGELAQEKAVQWAGLRLSDELRGPVLRSRAVYRDRVLLAALAGAIVAFALSYFLSAREPWDVTHVTYSLAGAGAAAVICGWTLVWRNSTQRVNRAGSSIRPNGVRLVDYVGLPTIIASVVLAVLLLAGVGYGLSLMSQGSESFRASYAIATFVLFSVLAVAIVGSLVLAALVTRRPHHAVSDDALAWDDALASNRILQLLVGPAYIAVFGSGFLGTTISDLIGDYESAWGWNYLMPIALVLLIPVVATTPWTAYLRSLWPDVYARGKAEKREARRIRRETERRAYNGLPPLPRDPVDAERDKYAPFGE